MNDEELAGTVLDVYEKEVASNNTRITLHRHLSSKTYTLFYDFSSSKEIIFLNHTNKHPGTFRSFLSVLGLKISGFSSTFLETESSDRDGLIITRCSVVSYLC